MHPSLKTKRLSDYKWVIVGICFLMVFFGLGFCSSSRSLFVKPVTEAWGIKRSLFALSDTTRYISTSVINIFFAALIGKFGAKKLICAGLLSLMLSMLFFAFGTNVLTFCLAGVFLGLGLAWTTTTMVGSVINKWCKKNTGTILGAVLAANGIGAALATQLFSPIIQQGRLAYRNAYLLTVLILATVLLAVIIFFRNNPKTTPSEEAAKNNKKSFSWEGIAYADAIKKPYFYIACVCIFLTGMVLQGITGVVAAHMDDVGIAPASVAAVLSLHSLTLTASKFLTGFAYDRFGVKKTSGLCFCCAIATMLLLFSINNSPLGVAMSFAYAVIAAFALPLETIMLPIYAKDLFGEKSYNKFLGIFVSVNTAGYALGGFSVNLCFDFFGSYRPAFGLFAAVMTIIFIFMQIVISASAKEREKA